MPTDKSPSVLAAPDRTQHTKRSGKKEIGSTTQILTRDSLILESASGSVLVQCNACLAGYAIRLGFRNNGQALAGLMASAAGANNPELDMASEENQHLP